MAQNEKKSRASSQPLNAAKAARKQGARAANQTMDFTKLLLSGANNEAMEKMMNQSKSQFDKMAQDASDIGRESFEAWMKSSSIFAKGCEDIFRQSMAIAQSAAEKQSQLFKEALSSKTLNEFTEAQSKIAQANFDDFMAGATKISELSARILTESAEPLNDQMTKGMRKASDVMAA